MFIVIICVSYTISIFRLLVKSCFQTQLFFSLNQGNLDIDIVYTWVNGSDPFWSHRRLIAENNTSDKLDKKTVRARFFDFNELIFSIRSVEKYIPWFHKIYIVTDNQTNHFLKPTPRIVYVDHKQIFPADALPSYNSNAIEFSLANIPGLSEHFLYLNDDCFFSRQLPKGAFFDIRST